MSDLKNKDPKVIEDAMDLVKDLLSRYGWHVLGVIIVSVFIWNKFVSKIVYQMRQQNEDPEVMVSRAEQMERARRRQQEIYDKQLEEFKQKETEKQNQKKNQLKDLINITENTKDLRKRNSKPLRDNSFNPMMGSTSGSTYRPNRACGPSGGA